MLQQARDAGRRNGPRILLTCIDLNNRIAVSVGDVDRGVRMFCSGLGSTQTRAVPFGHKDSFTKGDPLRGLEGRQARSR